MLNAVDVSAGISYVRGAGYGGDTTALVEEVGVVFFYRNVRKFMSVSSQLLLVAFEGLGNVEL